MSHKPTSSPEQFIQGAPVFHVRDVKATAQYYRDVLGFMWDYEDENYCVVWRDNSAIHFVKGEGTPCGIHLFQWVKDVDAVYVQITENGATISTEVEDREYGLRDFRITDPNGTDIVFG